MREVWVQAHEFGVEKEEEPELELTSDEAAVVEKVHDGIDEDHEHTGNANYNPGGRYDDEAHINDDG